jgi:hypothetical protein
VSFEQLPQHVTDIGIKAYTDGFRQLLATQSATLVAQEEPKLQKLCFVDVPAMYQPFLGMPDPASFAPLISNIEAAMASLSSEATHDDPIAGGGPIYTANPVLDQLPAAGDLIQTWTGEAAQAFKRGYIDPFPSLVRNQFLLISTLRSALQAEQAIWAAARRDIDQIAETTLKALDAMHGSCHQTSWTLAFDVVAAVVGVALAIPSLGTSLGLTAVITLTAVGAGASVAADIPVEKQQPSGDLKIGGKDVKIGGHEVNEVIQSMGQAIKQAITAVNQTEEYVAGRLRSMAGQVGGRNDLFVSPRPALRDMNGGNATNSGYLGYST